MEKYFWKNNVKIITMILILIATAVATTAQAHAKASCEGIREGDSCSIYCCPDKGYFGGEIIIHREGDTYSTRLCSGCHSFTGDYVTVPEGETHYVCKALEAILNDEGNCELGDTGCEYLIQTQCIDRNEEGGGSFNDCGDGVCSADEDESTCPQDCGTNPGPIDWCVDLDGEKFCCSQEDGLCAEDFFKEGETCDPEIQDPDCAENYEPWLNISQMSIRPNNQTSINLSEYVHDEEGEAVTIWNTTKPDERVVSCAFDDCGGHSDHKNCNYTITCDSGDNDSFTQMKFNLKDDYGNINEEIITIDVIGGIPEVKNVTGSNNTELSESDAEGNHLYINTTARFTVRILDDESPQDTLDVKISIGHHPPGDPETITWTDINQTCNYNKEPVGEEKGGEAGVTVTPIQTEAIMDVTGRLTEGGIEYDEYFTYDTTITQEYEKQEVITEVNVLDSDGNRVIEKQEITLTEDCNNGKDDNLDGYTDCADPQCNDIDENDYGQNDEPMQCSDDAYNSTYCSANNEECKAPTGDVYYCSYGKNDDENTGLCCPQGYYKYCAFGGCDCIEQDECYDGTNDKECIYEYSEDEFSSWITSIYDSSDPSKWCVNPAGIDSDRGRACCLVVAYGDENYYSDIDGNIKIY